MDTDNSIVKALGQEGAGWSGMENGKLGDIYNTASNNKIYI